MKLSRTIAFVRPFPGADVHKPPRRASRPRHGRGPAVCAQQGPKALAAWYRDVLGVKVEAWGGAMLRYDGEGHPPVLVWTPFPQATSYMTPSTREFMIDFAVDDLNAILARLKDKGVAVLKRNDTDPNGRFAWLLDPDGAKIELWQAKAK